MTTKLPQLELDGRYTAGQTARILEIDNSTLYRWTKKGKIRVSGYFVCNGRPFYRGKEIIRAYREY